MKREVIPTRAFTRTAKSYLKSRPHMRDAVDECLQRLAEDAHDPRLDTHKLKGPLGHLWSATADYDLRILFEFITHDGKEAILLQDLGTHDDVYGK